MTRSVNSQSKNVSPRCVSKKKRGDKIYKRQVYFCLGSGEVGNTRPLRRMVGIAESCDALSETSHYLISMTARNWCFTINNPTDEEWPVKISTEQFPNLKILVAQLEKGEEGTRHVQGYLECKTPCRLKALKRILPRAHLERRRGSRRQAVEYVIKEETRLSEPITIGISNLDEFVKGLTPSKSSLKESLLKVKKKIDEGVSINQIAQDDDMFDTWVRYHRAFNAYQLIKTPPRDFATRVTVAIGPTGVGKSRYAMETAPGAYWKQRSGWWDGYFGHPTTIIDEFYGWLPFDLLLRLCDRYPLQVETKGGQVQFVSKEIIITSNSAPNIWYKNIYLASFIRRVSLWIVYNHEGIRRNFTNYEEAFDYLNNVQ